MSRSQHKQHERKRRRQQPWRGKPELASDPLPVPTVTVLVPPPGRSIHDPASYLAKLPQGRLSDALVELMEPYIPWPPRPQQLKELEMWLLLGAAVWNATVQGTDPGVSEAVRRWAKEAGQQPQDLADLVQQVAARKRALFPKDQRLVAGVQVVAEGKRATVLATSVSWVR